MRLIDADELIEHAWRDKLDSRELIAEMIEKAPTIKEIPTSIQKNMQTTASIEIKGEELQKLVDAAVATLKPEYEARLKADKVAMLEEIDSQFNEICFYRKAEWKTVPEIKAEYKAVIQQKIDALKKEIKENEGQ